LSRFGPAPPRQRAGCFLGQRETPDTRSPSVEGLLGVPETRRVRAHPLGQRPGAEEGATEKGCLTLGGTAKHPMPLVSLRTARIMSKRIVRKSQGEVVSSVRARLLPPCRCAVPENHSWLVKVRYISTKYTTGMTTSTPASIRVGAGQLPAHIRKPTQYTATRRSEADVPGVKRSRFWTGCHSIKGPVLLSATSRSPMQSSPTSAFWHFLAVLALLRFRLQFGVS